MTDFQVKISKEAHSLKKEDGIKSIIVIRQPYAYLEKELRNVFKGQDDIKVILDKRQGERRKEPKAVESDRRKSDRRTPKENLVEVVIST